MVHVGIENGLCEKSIFFSSSFHSYCGKSVIQQKANWSLSTRPSSSPMRTRALPASAAALSSSPAEKNTASPALIAGLLADRRLDRLPG